MANELAATIHARDHHSLATRRRAPAEAAQTPSDSDARTTYAGEATAATHANADRAAVDYVDGVSVSSRPSGSGCQPGVVLI